MSNFYPCSSSTITLRNKWKHWFSQANCSSLQDFSYFLCFVPFYFPRLYRVDCIVFFLLQHVLIYYKDKLIFLIIHPFCRILIFFNPKKSLNCHHSAYKKPYTQYVCSGITIESIPCSFYPVLAQSALLHTLTTSCLSSSASVNPFSPSSSSLDLFCSFSVTGLNDGSSCPRGKLNNLSANSYNERSVSI